MRLFANITNEAIAKLMYFDFLAAVVMVTLSYASLTNKVESLEGQQIEQKKTIKATSSDMSSAKTKLEVMARSQEDYQAYQREIQQKQTEELRDIKGMLMDMAKENRTHQEH